MSYSSGEAAEQVVRMTLNGVEVAAKISGKAAERLAVLLYPCKCFVPVLCKGRFVP